MSIKANEAAYAPANGPAYLLLTVTTLCWGANAVLGRLAVGEISPMLLVSLRWFGAFALLMVFANRHIRRDWPTLRRHLPFLTAMGSLGFTAFNALLYVAAHSTTAVNIGIIQGAIPMFVLIGAFIAYRSPASALQMAGVAITMIGVTVIGSGGSLERLATLALNRGDLLMIIACSLYAGYTVGLRRRPAVSSLGLFTAVAGAAFLFSLPFTAVEAALGKFQWPTTAGWIIAALITLLPSFLAQIFFIRGVELIGPGRAGVFINLVPIFASIMAVAILSEPFETFHATALSLVLAGIALSERAGRT